MHPKVAGLTRARPRWRRPRWLTGSSVTGQQAHRCRPCRKPPRALLPARKPSCESIERDASRERSDGARGDPADGLVGSLAAPALGGALRSPPAPPSCRARQPLGALTLALKACSRPCLPAHPRAARAPAGLPRIAGTRRPRATTDRRARRRYALGRALARGVRHARSVQQARTRAVRCMRTLKGAGALPFPCPATWRKGPGSV